MTRLHLKPARELMTGTELTHHDAGDLPDYLKGASYKPQDDGFGMDDVVVPRIKLLQGLSKEVTEMYPGVAMIGDFWHTGLDISLGSSFRFIVADRRRKYLLSAPIADGQGILARADDAKTWDRTGKWSVRIKNVKQPVEWVIKDLDVAKSGLAEWGTYIPGDADSPPGSHPVLRLPRVLAGAPRTWPRGHFAGAYPD